MNIQALTPKFFRNDIITRSNQNGLNVNNASYPNLRPLEKDTVSFGAKTKFIVDVAEAVEDVAKKKVAGEWNYETPITRQGIIDLLDSFEKPFSKFLRDLKAEMKHLVATDSKPNNPIMPGLAGIKGRIKSVEGVEVKSNSRKLFTIEQIAQMGDVAGARIVMRDASPENTALVFDAIGNMVKKGAKIKEVENYRSTPKNSYVSQSTLDEFEALCQKFGQYPEIKNKSLPNSYTAVHVTFELPDGKLVELQIMGRDMENVKEVEDLFYKWRCEKDFAPKYRPIQTIFERIMPTLDDFQNTTLARYIKDSYEHALEIPAMPAKRKPNYDKDYFLPFPYSLPQELSYKNLHRMMEECNGRAKKK